MTFFPGIVENLHPIRLRLLVELGRGGSLSAAADVCHISQPSASKHIKALEMAIGTQLVERNGRSLGLTEAGSVVAAGASEMLDVARVTEEQLDALRDGARGTLRLAASTTAGAYVLPSILGCFADRHPGVDIDLDIGSSSSVADRLQRREASFGIAGEAGLGAGIDAEPFLDDQLVGVAAPGVAPLNDGELALEELRRHTLLVREPGSSTRMLWDRQLVQPGVPVGKRWELDSSEAIKRAAGSKLGLGLLSQRVVAEEAERGDLITFQLQGIKPATLSMFLLRASGSELTPAERAFVDTLNDCCASSISGCTVKNGRRRAAH